MVFAKVNGWEDTAMAQNWGIRGYPTLVLMKADGVEIDRIPGYAPAAEFITMIEDYMAGRGTLDDLMARFDAHPDSLGLIYQIGGKYQYRGADSAAEAWMQQLLGLDPGNDRGFTDSALHSLARIAYGAKRYDTAVARFEAVMARFPASSLAQDAATWVPYIFNRQEKYEDALKGFEQYLEKYPDASDADWVKRQIEALKARDI